jgi:hypothetical protein
LLARAGLTGAAGAGGAVGNVGVLATIRSVASIRGAFVAVVANQRLTSSAATRLAGLNAVTGNAVRTRSAVGYRDMLTAVDRIARISRTHAMVVTVGGLTGRARTRLTGFGTITGVTIGTRGPVGGRGVLTAFSGIARIGCAGIAVVAVRRLTRGANTGLAGLGAVASVTVIARISIYYRGVLTALSRVARIGRATIAVIAIERLTGRAGSRLASLGAVTGVAIGARGAVGYGDVLTAFSGITRISSADVAVVATKRLTSGAFTCLTDFSTVTSITIRALRVSCTPRARAALAGTAVAGCTVCRGRVLTTFDWITRIGRAGIAVVATKRLTGRARTRLAGFGAITGVAVGTRCAVGYRYMLAALGCIARIGRARIAVVATKRLTGRARTRLAGLSAIASVTVGARRTVSYGDVLAIAGSICRVLRARIAVIAIDGLSSANAGLAGFTFVRRVAVVTRGTVGYRGVLTAFDRVAGISGAYVTVVARKRLSSLANTLLTGFLAVTHVGIGA